jgi:N-methylhydantoinase B/oxoprolinase/acetone carboxylase alpha subunit
MVIPDLKQEPSCCTESNTSFSDFIRNASPDEKEAVYKKVIDEARHEQEKVLRELVQETQKLGGFNAEYDID